MSTNTSLLTVAHVAKRFGGVQALSDAGLDVAEGEIHGLIGPNGAGKTSLFNVITGWVRADAGQMHWRGQPFAPKAAHEVARAGIARTFQNIRLFADMSVLDNVRVGRDLHARVGWWQALLRSPAFVREEQRSAMEAEQDLAFVGLAQHAQRTARTLSYGDQRRLEIARAMATRPRLLALDEPAAGMNATEKQQLRDLVRRIRDGGCAVLIIEHDVKLVMGLCDRVTVLDQGRIIASGTPAQVQAHPAVIAAYLGSSVAKTGAHA